MISVGGEDIWSLWSRYIVAHDDDDDDDDDNDDNDNINPDISVSLNN
jgi:hypothetical protein